MYRPGRSRRPNSLRTCVRMRASADVATVLSLKATGMSASAIARPTGLPRSTVRDWMRGQVPHTSRPAPRLLPLPPPPERDYAYLLGLYLGDGCLSAHPRGVHRLRIYLDLRYPGIVEECEGAIHAVAPRNRVNRLPRRSRYTGQATATHVEVSCYSKHWAVLFPQHGPGRNHHRPIVLARWQRTLTGRHPQLLLRGLIHSDGCRSMNTGTGWRHPRYSLSNRSKDILGIFCGACDALGLHWTTAPHTVYVSRQADVARMERVHRAQALSARPEAGGLRPVLGRPPPG